MVLIFYPPYYGTHSKLSQIIILTPYTLTIFIWEKSICILKACENIITTTTQHASLPDNGFISKTQRLWFYHSAHQIMVLPISRSDYGSENIMILTLRKRWVGGLPVIIELTPVQTGRTSQLELSLVMTLWEYPYLELLEENKEESSCAKLTSTWD